MATPAEVVEVVESNCNADRLYWMCHDSPPRNLPGAYYFCIDSDLVYEPFCNDFGPLNLGMVFHYCRELDKLMKTQAYSSFRIYHYTSWDAVKRVNSAFLVGAFQVLVLGRTGAEAWGTFERLQQFPDYRDASLGVCNYRCTVLHCLRGLEIAVKLGWLSYSTFNLEDYEKWERLENGDMNWIIPGKMLAFSCPSTSSNDEGGWRCYTPEDYVPEFRRMGIDAVVRLNKKTYDATVPSTQRFTRAGLRHYDLYFLDGSVPSEDIVQRFLTIAENEPKGLAIHCKAGLGRTGTLIGIYAMKHFGFPPAEFIGWIRVCRPGSVLGPQQQFLVSIEATVQRWACEYRLENAAKSTPRKKNPDRSESFGGTDYSKTLSPEDKSKASFGDVGQAERLISAKKSVQSPAALKPSPAKTESKTPKAVRGQSLSPVSPPKRVASQTKVVFVNKNTTVFTTTAASPVPRKTKSRSIFKS